MPADLDGLPWQPEPALLHAAATVPMQYPSVLVRTIGYALNFLDRELAEHPEDEMMARAEAGDVYSLLVEITAALHGLDPDANVTDEQIRNTRYWMLGQPDSPSNTSHRPKSPTWTTVSVRELYSCKCIYSYTAPLFTMLFDSPDPSPRAISTTGVRRRSV
ncbi:hypothetical protein [Prescottella subtropica]|uniref:hypothetical protein n=1 Tax=Prescottella subtropica TaxID=2545757 RepID=UPI0010F7F168|nr:hypothetical protein [Prescottella subtropica]